MDSELAPKVFISATHRGLSTCRRIAKGVLPTLGCTPVEYPRLSDDAGAMREVLRKSIAACRAIVYFVGDVDSSELSHAPTCESRSNYTQVQYEVADRLENIDFFDVSLRALLPFVRAGGEGRGLFDYGLRSVLS